MLLKLNKSTSASDPIHQEDDKWYFWIETWADREGPFDTRELAETAMDSYCKNILGS